MLSRPAWPSSLRLVSNMPSPTGTSVFTTSSGRNASEADARSGASSGAPWRRRNASRAGFWFAALRSRRASNSDASSGLCGNDFGPRTRAFSVSAAPRASYTSPVIGFTPHRSRLDAMKSRRRARRLLRELGQTFLLRLPRLVLARLAAHRGLGSAGLAAAHPAELKRALARVQGHGHVPRVGSGGALALLPVVLGDPRILSDRCDFAFPAGGGLVSSSYTRCGPSLGSQSTMTRRGRTRSRPRPPGHRGEGVRRSTIARAKRVPSSLRATKHAAVEIEVTSSRHEECLEFLILA